MDGVREAARKDGKLKFNALMHHVNEARLTESFKQLKKTATVGVDKVTWHEYEQNMGSNITDRHGRIHRGAYRAKPTRRVWIPKPDGRQRPLGVASLEDTPTTTVVASANDASADDEDTLLEFASCMRDNGVEDFEDPSIGADGVPEFNLRGGGSDTDRDVVREAFEACSEHLEGLAFGPGSIDVTELADTLVEFAACMRDNGYDMPDPDLSNFGERDEANKNLFVRKVMLCFFKK